MRFAIVAISLWTALAQAPVLAQEPAAVRDWRFGRSYFTHEMTRAEQARYPLPQSRSAYRPAYVGHLPGFSIEGGFRINRIQINSGSSSDSTYIYEGWFRAR